jgi:protein-tyrosine phosphatase/membrane-associated phospholipid phosphatase
VTVAAASAAAVAAPERRPWGRALGWLALLGPFFFISYGAANWLAAQRSDVGAIFFAWERAIPFLPWTILPYWSIDALYGLSFFVCTSRAEVDLHGKRLLTAQLGAVICFILFPLRFAFARPAPGGLAGDLFDALMSFDRPFNQAPSLHIALLVILWALYARHVPHWARWPLHLWFAVIGASVLTTYQHHFIDVPTGALLGFFCLWLWPDGAPSPIAGAAFASDGKRRRLALAYAAAAAVLAGLALASGGAGLWLLWGTVALALVAANYGLLGAAGFQKRGDGQMSLAARWLLAPYLFGAWINSRLWTRRNPDAVAIAGDVWLGRLPSRRDAGRYVTVFDLAAELPGHPDHGGYHALPLLDLVVPEPERLHQVAAGIENALGLGPVLVCCALGHSRSAAGIAAWLLCSGRIATAAEAVVLIRRAAPRIVLDERAHAAIEAAAGRRP